VALLRGATLVDKGGDPSTRDIGDLFKAAALQSNDMTSEGIRDDAGHLISVGLSRRRDYLSELEGKGPTSSDSGDAGRGLRAFACALRT
jgi:hypothetical protein